MRSRRVAVAALLVVVAVAVIGVLDEPPRAGASALPSVAAGEDDVELVLFWGEGCPFCERERSFLDDLAADNPDLVVREYEVYRDAANQARFRQMATAAGIEARAVPTTFLGERVWVGFDDAVAAEITAAVEAALDDREDPGPEGTRRTVDVPFVGPVDVGGRSLVLSTALIAFVDGVNPCSLWVLTMLLALVLHSGSRRRVVAVGTVFLGVTSAMYGLYILGAYSALSYASFLPWIQRAVALVAGVLGLLQLKDAVGIDRGPSLGVPSAAKPGMYQRMRELATTDRPTSAMLGATVALAVGVSLLETPCTLGLPILWTNLVADSGVPLAGAALLFAVYLAVFLVDELVVFGGVVLTMRAIKVQERHGRGLKLVSGTVMLALALVMVVRPTTLETVGGALAVFGLAAAVAAVGLLLLRGVEARR